MVKMLSTCLNFLFVNSRISRERKMSARPVEKLHLSANGLLKAVMKVFERVKESPRGSQGKDSDVHISDCLMAGLAMFKLKYPSLLQFDTDKRDKTIEQNLRALFSMKNIPSDTYMRERLDKLDPRQLRRAFTTLFSKLQRGKVLEEFIFLEGKYLMLSDGTGLFSSHSVRCENCCEKHSKKTGKVTYYHQLLGAVLAHPDHREVIPLCPEPIMKWDGAKKNDCERNATERLLRDFRREHPHLPVILVEDGLAANGPHIKLLKELGISFITVVKPEGNKALFEWVEGFDWRETDQVKDKSQGEYSFVDKQGSTHKFRYVNDCPLNDTHKDLRVNFLEYWVIDKNGKQKYHNSWVTDTQISQNNAYNIARGGRVRWHIENETFNTLKTQGYHFEHNFGHGDKNLCTVFAMLMMLAFLIDQCEQFCCGLFQGALCKLNSTKKYLWERIRAFFVNYIVISWDILYQAIISGDKRIVPALDSS